MRGVTRQEELIGTGETPGRESVTTSVNPADAAPEQRFGAVADSAPALVWMSDPSGRCTYFNRGWLDFRGRTMEQELGDGWAEGVHPDDLERCLRIYRGALQARTPFEMEYRLRRHDGAYRWILDRGSPMLTEARFTGMVGICVDVHARRLAEERSDLLVESAAALTEEVEVEARLQTLAGLLARQVGDLCIVDMADADGRLEMVAGAARDPELEPVVQDLRRRTPLPADDPRGMVGVSRTGQAALIAEVTPELLDAYVQAAGVDDASEAAIRKRPPRSIIVAPLPARGRTLGALLLVTYGDRRLGDDDLALVEEVTRRAGLALDNARLFRESRETAQRLRLLQEATAALSSAAGPDEVAEAAVERVRALLGATVVTIFEIVGSDLAALARHGRTEHELGVWERVPLETSSPVTDAVRERRPVWIESRAGWRERYPEIAPEAERRGLGAGVALPLVAGNDVVGALALAFDEDRRFGAADRDTARGMAEACGQALARARLQRRAEIERGRAELLAEVSFALDYESGVEERLGRLAGLLVERIADLVTIRIAGDPAHAPRLAAVAHVDPQKQDLVRSLYGQDAAPDPGPARVMATGRPELVADAVGAAGRDDAPEGFADRLRRLEVISYMSVPLTARGALFGALTVMTTTDSGRRYGADDLAMADEMARRAALTIDNARIYEAELEARAAAEREHGRTERLQRVTAALAAALTVEDVARAVVQEAMQALSAVAGAVLLREAGEARVLVATGYPDDVLRVGLRVPVDGHSPLAHVLRAGEELWLEEAADWTRRFAPPHEELRAAGIGLPLRAGGEVVGAIGFRFGRDRRRFSPGDRDLARAMAGQCALALERVRLYETERHAASVLQRALLPAALPPPASARLAVRYLPAAGRRSGGDFYDAVELSDGRLSLVVGDVVGHGVEAAAVMGQLRSAWRASALEGADPATTVRRLSRFAERLEGASVATVACAVLAGSEMSYASAGHPPPLLRHPDGATDYLMDGRGPPLAVSDDAYGTGRIVLEPGSLVLLYTDGVIERHRDLERGMAELAELVGGGSDDPRDVLAALARAVGPEPADDCALLALRVPDPDASLRRVIPSRPSAVRGARVAVRRWLLDAGVERRDAEAIVLAASEAVANSVEHAYAGRPPAQRPGVELEMARDGEDALSVVVRDHGRWRPPGGEDSGRGRGLMIMRALMESVEIEPGEEGTTVRMRRRLRAGPEEAPRPAPSRPEPAIEVDGGDLVRLDGDLDESAAPALARRLRELALARGSHMRLDLTDASYIGSVGVRLLVELSDELRRGGGGLEVVAPPGTIARRVLDLTQVGIPLAPEVGP